MTKTQNITVNHSLCIDLIPNTSKKFVEKMCKQM